MEDLKSVDVCLIADVGSTRVIRFAEKGRYRFKLEARGIPCYSCGVEGGNMGAPDEYVDFDELDRVFQTHLYSCLEFLSSP
ncbi:hypothetical protein MAF45_03105 [Mesosutterella sp. OilRF-GAM-744-9]|uniref:Uncharacterized protein n=1 Tax=Mesosutterella porci TaxID=2915351 RepID=A0ABS9MP96_9BURK|nr:hypothetical protein [Mesosutterella sp. oilRF-744-WT-GAM-9]MCG5030436.1 hypothetical protein [Mesosutterella sp. oilRF-744-WT-GAM-9]